MGIPFAAQAEEIYLQEPQCAVIKNDTKQKQFVSIRTDYYAKPDGSRSYFEEVLHLEPDQDQEVCVKGPFLPGYKVTLTVKSFIPLFECDTKLAGEISIQEKETEKGGHEIFANCVE
jgi:hypothetical protein